MFTSSFNVIDCNKLLCDFLKLLFSAKNTPVKNYSSAVKSRAISP